jgi:hypothetical protein
MRVVIDERFVAEAARLELRFTCGDCGHRLADGRCAHEWPNDEHKDPPVLAPGERREILFCKEFELS